MKFQTIWEGLESVGSGSDRAQNGVPHRAAIGETKKSTKRILNTSPAVLQYMRKGMPSELWEPSQLTLGPGKVGPGIDGAAAGWGQPSRGRGQGNRNVTHPMVNRGSVGGRDPQRSGGFLVRPMKHTYLVLGASGGSLNQFSPM